MLDPEAFAQNVTGVMKDVWQYVSQKSVATVDLIQRTSCKVKDYVSVVGHVLVLLLFWLAIICCAWIILFTLSQAACYIWRINKRSRRRHRAERQPLIRRYHHVTYTSFPAPMRGGHAVRHASRTRQPHALHDPSRSPPRRHDRPPGQGQRVTYSEPQHAHFQHISSTSTHVTPWPQHQRVLTWLLSSSDGLDDGSAMVIQPTRRPHYGAVPTPLSDTTVHSLAPPPYHLVASVPPPSYDSQARHRQNPPPPYSGPAT